MLGFLALLAAFSSWNLFIYCMIFLSLLVNLTQLNKVICAKLDTEFEPSNLNTFESHWCKHFSNKVLVRTHLWKNL